MLSPSASRGPCVLLVEDDDGVRRSLQLLLQWNGFEVRAHGCMKSAIELESLAEFDLLLSDYFLLDGDGITLLHGLRERDWQGRAVLMTGETTPWLTERARRASFHAVLEKPLARGDLMQALVG